MKPEEIAIVIFTYGRLYHTKITLQALSINRNFKRHPVIIFSDGPNIGHEEKVESVRGFLRKFKKNNPNVTIVERKKNLGLEKSIITGISETLKRYPAVIVIEDDIRTSPAFLGYMVKMLSMYKDNLRIGSISGYSHPKGVINIPTTYKYEVFFVPRTSSWGWATWRDRWDDVDWDVSDIDSFIKDKEAQKEFNRGGKDLSRMLIKQVRKGIDTWDIQWSYHNFKKKRLTVYPVVSFVENIGHDGTGVHCGISSTFENEHLNTKELRGVPNGIVLDEDIVNGYKKVFEMTTTKFMHLAFNKILKETRQFLKI